MAAPTPMRMPARTPGEGVQVKVSEEEVDGSGIFGREDGLWGVFFFKGADEVLDVWRVGVLVLLFLGLDVGLLGWSFFRPTSDLF
jgi:hypothetical protein